jgi:hypothetical protein
MLYFFGIPGGRYGSVELARVPETEILDQSAYQYYAGRAGGGPVWSSQESAAVPVVPAPSGELSVMWDPYLGRWIMVTGNPNDSAIEMRDSPTLWGDWSNPHILIGQDYSDAYGGYMHPFLTQNGGQDIYLTVSRWGSYAVYLFHAHLDKGSPNPPVPIHHPVPPVPIHQPGQPQPI